MATGVVRVRGLALWSSVGLLVAFLAEPGTARAETCPDEPVGAPDWGAVSVDDRLEFLRGSLDSEERRVRRWSWIWGSIFTVGASGYVGLGVLSDDEPTKADRYVSSIKSGIGALAFVVTPVRIQNSGLERNGCEGLRVAERALRVSADNERKARLLGHFGGAALNLSGALFLGLQYDRWALGLLGASVGILVGEIKIYTQPTGAMQAARTYRRGRLTRVESTSGGKWAVLPMLHPEGFGLSLAFGF